MTEPRKSPESNSSDLDRDLGFGARVTQQSRKRLLNPDGSFNVARLGLTPIRSLGLFHYLLTISWTRFALIVALAYLGTNMLFAGGYWFSGEDALHGSSSTTSQGRLLDAFFFSVQTLATIGYGRLTPNNLAANILVSIEALLGLSGFALTTGILFARFSQPSAKILFSRHAIVAPYRGIRAFEFRIANKRSNQLTHVEATVVLSMLDREDGTRHFFPLELERQRVMFFPLHWVIVHPIDESSPMKALDARSLEEADPEFLILLSGMDETFSQTVQARSSYKFHELVWGARFSDMFQKTQDGIVTIDLRRIHDIESAPLP